MLGCMRNILIILAVVLGLGIVGFFALNAYIYEEKQADAPRAETDEERVRIETYVREHFSALSPETAVLGGTFYVTAIEARDGTGVVEYEDGHIALVADFSYLVDDRGEVFITSFTVRPQ